MNKKHVFSAILIICLLSYEVGAQSQKLSDYKTDEKFFVGYKNGQPVFNDFTQKFLFTIGKDSTVLPIKNYNPDYYIRLVSDKIGLYSSPKNHKMIIEKNSKETEISYSGGDLYCEAQPSGENVFYSVAPYNEYKADLSIKVISGTKTEPEVLPLKGTVLAATNNYLYYGVIEDPDGTHIMTVFRVKPGKYDKPEKLFTAPISPNIKVSDDDSYIIVERVHDQKFQRLVYQVKSGKASLIPFGLLFDTDVDNEDYHAGVSFDLKTVNLQYFNSVDLSLKLVPIPKVFDVKLD